MEREQLSSRLGFILLSAGCAIGIGNVWKFPYIVGQSGGAVFIGIYLLFLILLGIPVLCMEFSLGRASKRSCTKMYQQLTPHKSRWFWHGKVALAGNYLLMMFYTTVAGWMFKYFIDTASGAFENATSSQIADHFQTMTSNGSTLVFFMGTIVVIGFLICAVGLQKGLERITKIMMLFLLAIMLLLAVHSIFLPGAKEGLEFYFMPDFSKIREIGLGKVIVTAMNQAFFTLSLGMGGMAIFGSYIGKEHSLLKESVHVALLDTFVAIVAGMIIIPACFAYNVEVSSGPSLIFLTLPNIFCTMPYGRLWGSLFFIFMTFAALSTVLGVFENIISATMDLTNWSRKKTCLVSGVALFILSLPCALGFNLLSSIQPLGPGSTIMDLLDFIVSQFVLPIGSLVFVLYCTTKTGWGWESFMNEANTGHGSKIKPWMKYYARYVLPICITIIFFCGFTL